MRRRHVGMHQHRDGEAAEGRAPELLREQRRRPRVQSRAAEFLGIPQAEIPEPPHLLQHLARHEALLFPGAALRDDLLLDVAANALAQQAESIVHVYLRPNCSRSRATASGSPRTRRMAPVSAERSSSTVQVAKICPRSFCADQGRKSSASTRRFWKNPLIASRSFAMSPSLRALITMHPGCCARSAASSPPRSILLNTSRRGTSRAPISSSTSCVTWSCRSYPGSLASTTWARSEASSASPSVDLNEATSPSGRSLMKPTVSLTTTLRTAS